MSFAIGSLVSVRGREWTVLPESTDDLLILHPLGGTDDEIAGIVTALEAVRPAEFAVPDSTQPGDYRSARLLRDAIRLGFRSSAGPFRSFARLGVEPRPYQLVPLLLALKLDPVRLLIADDVGIGKTIEAGLIARELLDRGEITRLAVLCPPPLAEQWQGELQDKFHIAAELVLPGSAAKLERSLRNDESLFDVYPFTIVSLDYIKSERHRSDFIRACPEFVIVDEAHTCAAGGEGRSTQHQRHRLVADLAGRADRHLILVTATPHSGNEGGFRSLLELLSPDFRDLPADLSGTANERARRDLAAHFIQRRRGDIQQYLQTATPFPAREDREEPYTLTPEYRAFIAAIVAYARETVRDPDGRTYRQRVRWWSALALLRSVASSPAAAIATLRNRATLAEDEDPAAFDARVRRTILDLVEEDTAEGSDLAPAGDASAALPDVDRGRRRLLELAEQAEGLVGARDAKLAQVVTRVKALLHDGFRPIIFCRFIPTAEYVKDALRAVLPKDVAIEAVTGLLAPAEREERVAGLGTAKKRILVCTDCLSEGINLQGLFDAIIHYDLAWNPTRHEQREGRVDRYGQPSPTVRVITCYGVDNQIDGIVLDILLRKHKQIRTSLGISVPVPVDTNQVMEAVLEGLLLREGQQANQLHLPGLELPLQASLFARWDASAERERRTRTIFAQQTIKVDEVFQELQATSAAIGAGTAVAAFVRDALRAAGATVGAGDPLTLDLEGAAPALRDALGPPGHRTVRFELPVGAGVTYLSRTHPFVEGLAAYVMEQALDNQAETAIARRCGVIRTAGVATRTTLLLLRLRYHLITEYTTGQPPKELLAEEVQLAAFTGSPQAPDWLDEASISRLLSLEPSANINPGTATAQLNLIIDSLAAIRPALDDLARQHGQALLAAHTRVRAAARTRGVLRQRVVPQLPADILGMYLYLPFVAGGLA